jgi:hypothetical protein
MPKSKCTRKGGSFRDAVRAIFTAVEPGVRNDWFTYECPVCGKHHIASPNEVDTLLRKYEK